MKLSALLLLSTLGRTDAFFKSHDIITHDDGSVHLFEKTQHRRLATKNLKTNSDAANTKFTVHGSEYVTGKMHVDGIATVGGLEFENLDATVDVFGPNALNSLAGAGLSRIGTELAVDYGTTPGTALAGDTTTISGAQASAITANTAKTGITSGQASAITANTAKVSMTFGTTGGVALEGDTTTITSGQAFEITANTAKTVITSAQSAAITANTAKTGITSAQASEITAAAGFFPDITANTAKTGITSAQANAITANTGKQVLFAADGSGITINYLGEISANLDNGVIKMYVDAADVINANNAYINAAAILLNTAKTGITSAQSAAITDNTGKQVLTAAGGSGITINYLGEISANVDNGVIKDALDALEAADTTTAVQKEYRLERMVLLLCNTLGLKFEHLVRAVDGATFDPYERFSAIQVNDDDLYSAASNGNFVVVTDVSTALCSTYSGYTSACADGYSNRHALAMCSFGACAPADFTASGLCCVPN